MSEGLSGRHSVSMWQNGDSELWSIKVRNDNETVIQRKGLKSKPDWIFESILGAYHFGERCGRDYILEKYEEEKRWHKNRSFLEKLSGIICWLIGHKMSKQISGSCERCSTIFGIYKKQESK